MSGNGQKVFAMKLNNDEKPYAPQGMPEYLCILKNNQSPPADKEAMLLSQVELLRRLTREATEGELMDGNRRLEQNLQQEELQNLPAGKLKNPKTPLALLTQPAVMGTPLADWKWGMDEAQSHPPMPEPEARQEAEELSLESFLSRLL